MSQVQFGLTLPISNAELPPQEFLRRLRIALSLVVGSFDSVWLADHLQFGETSLLEGWTTLTYLAALRPELNYGHLVLCQLFRNPALLAKMAATFQYLSRGHFLLGIGVGWAEEEAKAYHLPFLPAGPRVSALEEQVQIIKALWREKNVTFEGRYHQVHQAFCQPHPEPPPPLLIAARQPRMMRVVARYADWWNTAVEELDQAKGWLKALDAACEMVGRDPKTLRRTAAITCACAETEHQLKALTAVYKGANRLGFVGTPTQIVDQLHPFIEAGFDYFMIDAVGVPDDFMTVELLAKLVLPVLDQGR